MGNKIPAVLSPSLDIARDPSMKRLQQTYRPKFAPLKRPEEVAALMPEAIAELGKLGVNHPLHVPSPFVRTHSRDHLLLHLANALIDFRDNRALSFRWSISIGGARENGKSATLKVLAALACVFVPSCVLFLNLKTVPSGTSLGSLFRQLARALHPKAVPSDCDPSVQAVKRCLVAKEVLPVFVLDELQDLLRDHNHAVWQELAMIPNEGHESGLGFLSGESRQLRRCIKEPAAFVSDKSIAHKFADLNNTKFQHVVLHELSDAELHAVQSELD